MSGRRRTAQSPLTRVGTLTLLALLALLASSSFAVAAQQSTPTADNTVTHITVQSSGNAIWTVQIRTRLDTQQRLNDFQAFSASVKQNASTYLDPFRSSITKTVSRAGTATGRPMKAHNFSLSTSIQEVPRRWGVVTFAFTWDGFAAHENGELVVGDVFQGGFFLAENDSLVIAINRSRAHFGAVEPDPDETTAGQLTWYGRADFADSHPSVVIVPNPSANTTKTNALTRWFAGLHRGLALTIGGLLLGGLVAIGGYSLWRRAPIRGPRAEPPNATSAGLDPAEDHTTPTGDVILTDAERVEQTLNAHGGRMKQADIATALEWSPSKVSRTIAEMVEDNKVNKLQLGRENLVELEE